MHQLQRLMSVANRSLVAGWKWKDSKGNFWYPARMETRHLFYTLRMIWNNTMPADAHVGYNIRYYTFGSFYSERYLKEAIVLIYSELAQRKDMRSDWKRELEKMRSYFNPELNKIENELLFLS